MTDRSGLESIGKLLGSTLIRLGVDDLDTMLTLIGEWSDLVGDAWARHGTPLILRGGTLVVEADNPTVVRLLRYGEQDLLKVLQRRFGSDSVTAVEVVAPRP